MDDSGRSQELITSVNIVPHMRTEVVKLSAGSSIKTDEGGEPPPELINTQYINIHRVPETLGKALVGCESPTQQGLMSGELIQHHVVHGGMVVDMMVPPVSASSADFSQHGSLDRTTLPHYIQDHYDATEDLLPHDLTEDDRRLAAALVAVQLVQQQKQQHHHVAVTSESNVIVSPSGLPSLITTASSHLGSKVPVSLADHHMTALTPLSPVSGVPVEKPGMAAMVTSYIQAVEEEAAAVASTQQLLDQHGGDRILKMYQPQPQHQDLRLPPLPPLKKVLSQSTIRSRYVRPHLQQEVSTTQPGSQLGTRLSHTAADMKEEYDVKSEGDDDSEDIPNDDNDSDYDIENDLRPSRKSLPHKKRIPRKLKNMKKSTSPSRSMHAKCYKCNKCGDQFGSQSAYSNHRLTSCKKVFSCELCGKGFCNQLKFFEHLKCHYEPTVMQISNESSGAKQTPNHKDKASCPKEDQIMQSEVVENKLPPTQETVGAIPPPLTCNQCGKTFRRQKAFETHMNLSHPKQEDIEEFSEPEDLMEGIRGVVEVGGGETGDEADMDILPSPPVIRSLKNNNDDKQWYREEDLHATEADIQEMEQQQQQGEQLGGADDGNVCDLCGDMFETKAHLSQHVQEEHLEFVTDAANGEDVGNPGKRRLSAKRPRRAGLHLTCPHCGRMFNHRNSLVYHLLSHTGERPHQCEFCGKSFFAASALKVHMRLHSGDKPYKCEYCGRHFRQCGDLKYHCISIHSEEKNYQCEYCGKDFARKYSLIVHRRIHTGEKNYKCEFCGKSFRASSYLQNHRRIHTGEKPHPCEVCGKAFRVRSDMKRHLNTHSRDRHRTGSANGETYHTLLQGAPKIELQEADGEQDSEDHIQLTALPPGQTLTVEHGTMPDLNPVTEITIQTATGAPESILPDESLGDSGVEQQPINLNIAVPAVNTRQSHQLPTSAQTVGEDVLHYARDPLETVRDGNNTLYVWPIYMT